MAAIEDADVAEAITRIAFGLTLATGAMVVATGLAFQDGVVVVALPTAAMAVLTVLRATHAAAWCGVVIWAMLLPAAQAEGFLAEMSMMAICAFVAIGPAPVVDWLTDDRTRATQPGDPSIEEL